MTVSIRPHHLLCILTYLGKGYTARFVETYTNVVTRLNAGEPIELVRGPDDICRPMLSEEDCHCRNDSVAMRDDLALGQIGAVLDTDLKPGDTLALTREQVLVLRSSFANGSIRTACAGCDWQDLCTTIAESGFRACRLFPTGKHT